jgi:hypothetical protein
MGELPLERDAQVADARRGLEALDLRPPVV